MIPGLLCYAAYRAARLWLPSSWAPSPPGPSHGLATMLVWEDWYHIYIAAGALLLPAALEAAVRLKRRPRARQAVVVGLVIGASVLVNQESAFMVALVAVLVVASPQLVAMIVQYSQGGVTVSPQVQARWDASFGTPLSAIFAPSPRLADFGLTGLASLFSHPHPREGAPTFGVVLTALALLGVVGAGAAALPCCSPSPGSGRAARARPRPDHRRADVRPAAPALARRPGLGPMPYTWFVRIPALDAFL